MLKLILTTIFGFFIAVAIILSFVDLYPKQFKEFESFIGTNLITEKITLINKDIKSFINSIDRKLFYNR